MRNLYRRLLLILLCLGYVNAFCQTPEIQTWECYNHRIFIPKLRIWVRNDFQLRQSLRIHPTHIAMVRTRAIINLGSYINFQPGIDFHYTWYKEFINTSELRFFQGVGVNWPNIGRFKVDQFLRFEQRIFNIRSTTELGLRTRYQVKVNVPLNNNSITNKTFFMSPRCEVFYPHDKQIKEVFANTIRYGTDLGYNGSSNWRYFITLLIDHSKSEYLQDRTREKVIFSLTIRHVINIRSKKDKT